MKDFLLCMSGAVSVSCVLSGLVIASVPLIAAGFVVWIVSGLLK